MELKVYGVGNATADAELQYITGDRAVCNVTLAFNRSYKKGDEWQTEACFMRLQAFNAIAERMAERVKKGVPVFVEGYLSQQNWSTQEGDKRTAFVITVRSFDVCERSQKNGSNDDDNSAKTSKKPKKETEPVAVPANAAVQDSDDDIPF